MDRRKPQIQLISWCPLVWRESTSAPHWFFRLWRWRGISPPWYKTNWVCLSARQEPCWLRVRPRASCIDLTCLEVYLGLLHNILLTALSLCAFCCLVIFLVFSHITSVSVPLRGDVLLNCGFRQQNTPLSQEVGIEWRLQHRGKGRKVLEMKTRLDEAKENTVGKCDTISRTYHPWGEVVLSV